MGGPRNPRGEVINPEDVVRTFVAPGPGGRWNYRTVEGIELKGQASFMYRCVEASCRGIAFRSPGAAAHHRGAIHPGESLSAAQLARAAKRAGEPAADLERSYPPVTSLESPKKRRGRPPADPVLVEEAFLDAAAVGVRVSMVEFVDRLIVSRQRAIEGRKVVEAENERLTRTVGIFEHHLSQLAKDLRELGK